MVQLTTGFEVPDWLAHLMTVAPVVALIVPALSLVVAVVSLCIAISSRNTAKKSLGIAQRGEERIKPDLDLNLIRARQQSTTDGHLVVLSIEVINRSHSAIWIRRPSLWIDYLVGETLMTSEVSVGALPSDLGKALEFPLELKPREVGAGWLAFEISDARTNERPILRQSLRLTDTDGQEWSIDDVKTHG